MKFRMNDRFPIPRSYTLSRVRTHNLEITSFLKVLLVNFILLRGAVKPFILRIFSPSGNVRAVREDTHKKSGFFSGRTTKRGEGGNPPDH